MLLLNDYVIKNTADVIILITWLMLTFLLKSRDVVYQVSNDLGEVKCFYSSFSDAGQKPFHVFQKCLPGIGLNFASEFNIEWLKNMKQGWEGLLKRIKRKVNTTPSWLDIKWCNGCYTGVLHRKTAVAP